MARLFLTGGLRMEGPSAHFSEGDLPGRQGRIAFAALAVERQPIAHDRLAGIVRDDTPPAQWKSAVAAVVSKTRSLITRTGLDGAAVVVSYTFVPRPRHGSTWSMPIGCSTGPRGPCVAVTPTAWNRIGDHQLASVIAGSAVAVDPYREIGHRPVIEAESARGDRGAALRAYRRCERILAEELGVSPSAETLRLAETLHARPTD